MAAQVLFLPAILLPPRALDGLGRVVEERTVQTPWGDVGPVARRRLEGGDDVYILPYSGYPARLDPRATLWAAKSLGVHRVLTWERMVGLDHTLDRGAVVVPEDYIDWTHRLPTTLFADRGAGYLQQVPPFCPETHGILHARLSAVGLPIHNGTYVGVDGPRRETPAEARMFQKWGGATLGMNVIPEVVFAKELELCYGVLGTVTEPGADRPPQDARGEVRSTLRTIVEQLPAIIQALSQEPTCSCGQSQAVARAKGLLPQDWREWILPPHF
jgi:Purine nucleoside phosphorylase